VTNRNKCAVQFNGKLTVAYLGAICKVKQRKILFLWFCGLVYKQTRIMLMPTRLRQVATVGYVCRADGCQQISSQVTTSSVIDHHLSRRGWPLMLSETSCRPVPSCIAVDRPGRAIIEIYLPADVDAATSGEQLPLASRGRRLQGARTRPLIVPPPIPAVGDIKGTSSAGH